MHKLLLLLPLIVATSIPVGRPAVAGLPFAGPVSNRFVTDMADPEAALLLVAGKGGGGMGGDAMGGGMGAGAATGGMGGGATTGGMGGGTTTGEMGGGTTTGGMGGGMFGGGMPNNSAPSLGTNSSSGSPVTSTQSSYYTYQCIAPGGGCSIVAPASLRSSSFRPGARCSCSNGLSQGQIK
jgi:hypothetical protein